MAASVIWRGNVAGFSNSAGYLNLKAVRNNSMAGANSTMRPRETWITIRCMNVLKLNQAPSMGKMMEVRGHNGFRPVYASSPGSGGIEPEEPCDHTHVDEAPDMVKEKLNFDELPRTEVRVYDSYMKNHVTDEQSYAQAKDNKEVEQAIEVMRRVLELEEMYRKELNSSPNLRLHQLDLLFALIVTLLVGIRVSYALLTDDLLVVDNLTFAIIELFKILLSAVIELFRNALIEQIQTYGG